MGVLANLARSVILAAPQFTDGGVQIAAPQLDAKVLWLAPGPRGYEFGCTITSLGDLTGDGVVDLGVGASDTDWQNERAGRILFVDGANGRVFDTCVQPSEHLRRGWGDVFPARARALGDLDGDGAQDALFSVANDSLWLTRLCVLSGRTRRVSAEFTRGFGSAWDSRWAALGDVDCDGVDEWVTLERDGGWRLVQRSGLAPQARSPSAPLLVPAAQRTGPNVLESIADVDNDGVRDVLVSSGSPQAPNAWFSIYSGRTLAFLRALHGGEPADERAIRSVLVRAGEVFAELWSDSAWRLHALPLDGSPGRLVKLREFEAHGEWLAWTPIDDLDGDGLSELMLGTVHEPFARLSVIRGADGARLGAPITLPDFDEAWPSRLGFNLAAVGDLDGDGRSELALQLRAGEDESNDERFAVCVLKLTWRTQ